MYEYVAFIDMIKLSFDYIWQMCPHYRKLKNLFYLNQKIKASFHTF